VHDVKKIIAKLPRQRQTLFFSATMAPAIRKLADTLLTNPVTVEVAPVSSTAETISQSIYFVDRNRKQSLLRHLITTHGARTVLVFTRTKHGADRIARNLIENNISAAAIHGDKAQQARQKALLQFRAGQIQVLVATDIAARGIDIEELPLVINYDLPNVPETYVHRIGRTGRAGAGGTAVSFCDHEERVYLRDIQRLIKLEIPVQGEHPFASPAGSMEFRAPQQQKRPAQAKQNTNRFARRKREKSW